MGAEKVRLLICGVCKSIEELPWYEGPQEHDDTGNYRLSFHRFASGNYHPFTVGDVPLSDWSNPTRQDLIVKGITEQVEGLKDGGGLGNEFYDVKNTFLQDAMTCWKRHGRRTDCEDWKTDKMRLYPDTAADRRAANSRALPISPKGPSTFLCQFCPVNVAKVTKQREARGDYNKQPGELA